jgi:hypothetical protein
MTAEGSQFVFRFHPQKRERSRATVVVCSCGRFGMLHQFAVCFTD